MFFLLTDNFSTLKRDGNNLYFVLNYTQEYSTYFFMITYMSITVRLNEYIHRLYGSNWLTRVTTITQFFQLHKVQF